MIGRRYANLLDEKGWVDMVKGDCISTRNTRPPLNSLRTASLQRGRLLDYGYRTQALAMAAGSDVLERASDNLLKPGTVWT